MAERRDLEARLIDRKPPPELGYVGEPKPSEVKPLESKQRPISPPPPPVKGQ